MIVSASAKINLNLHITGQRADGYHLLESLVVFANVGDKLNFDFATKDNLTFAGPFAAALSGDNRPNLVAQARDALRDRASDQRCAPVSITLVKNLPIASGIGGGSADAAATLKGLNDLWQLGFSNDDLAHIGLSLGADVPMCICGMPLIAKGIGEMIDTVFGMPELPILLVNPGRAVSTPAIFKALITKNNAPLAQIPGLDGSLPQFIDWLKTTRNDLEGPAKALCPEIDFVLTFLKTSGAIFARMSGSGATCFGIFADMAAAEAARVMLTKTQPHWWVAG